MKFQNPTIHRSKVNGRTHTHTDRQAKSNMPFQLFQSWGHNKIEPLLFLPFWIQLLMNHEIMSGTELEKITGRQKRIIVRFVSLDILHP